MTAPRDTRIAVLIVEDEGIVAMDLQQTLDELGYDAFAVAASADEALRRAADRRPDIVLMDIRIDGPRDGIETATLLHEQYQVPIVYLTAHSDDATLRRAQQAEPYGYLMKPVQPADLKSAIEISIHKHSRICRELDELRRAVEGLQRSATRDELTGLLNRRGFLEQAGRALDLAARTQRPFAVAYFDLDGLKAINDELGHAAGDRALVAMADLLRASFRSTDLIARLGGDEFVALAVEYLEADDGETLRQRFHRKLAATHTERDLGFELAASLGVVIHDPSVERTLAEILGDADAHMYAAKQLRRSN